MIPLLVILGAAVGAPLRYATDRVVQSRHDTGFPWGTFTVNVVGSFVLGVVVGAGLGTAPVALVGIGFCGALTTFSTLALEIWDAMADDRYPHAAANVALSLTLGLGAAWLGWALAGG